MSVGDAIKSALSDPAVEAGLISGLTDAVTKIVTYVEALGDADAKRARDNLKAAGVEQLERLAQLEVDVASDEAAAAAAIDVIEANKKTAAE
jgi:hypothetical protein